MAGTYIASDKWMLLFVYIFIWLDECLPGTKQRLDTCIVIYKPKGEGWLDLTTIISMLRGGLFSLDSHLLSLSRRPLSGPSPWTWRSGRGRYMPCPRCRSWWVSWPTQCCSRPGRPARPGLSRGSSVPSSSRRGTSKPNHETKTYHHQVIINSYHSTGNTYIIEISGLQYFTLLNQRKSAKWFWNIRRNPYNQK